MNPNEPYEPLYVVYRKNAGAKHSVKVHGHLPITAHLWEARDLEKRMSDLARSFRDVFSLDDLHGTVGSMGNGSFIGDDAAFYPAGFWYMSFWDVGRKDWLAEDAELLTDAEEARVRAFFTERDIPVREYR